METDSVDPEAFAWRGEVLLRAKGRVANGGSPNMSTRSNPVCRFAPQHTSRRWLTAGVLLVLPLGLPAAGCDDGPREPHSVQVTPQSTTLQSVGETVQLTAEVLDSDGDPMAGWPIDWSHDPPDGSVCTVDNTGLVTAQGDGTCTATATATDTHPLVEGHATVTVQQEAVQLSFDVQPTDGTAEEALPTFTVCVQDGLGNTVANDNSTQMTVGIGADPSAGQATLSGSTSKTVASGCADFDDVIIDVEGVGYTLTVDAAGLTGDESSPFEVFRNIATVIVACPDATLEYLGEAAQCTAEARSPSDRVIPSVTFSWSHDPQDGSVCTVDNTGLVTAQGNGTCTVTATADEVSASDVVTVEQKAATVTISPEFTALGISETKTLNVQAEDAAGCPIASATISSQCDAPGVVSISGTDVTGVAAGLTQCRFTSDAAVDSARIPVVDQKGFAAIFTTDADIYRITATSGSTIEADFWMIRPTAGDGDLASIQGTLVWDPSVLTYVSSAVIESGWTWVPNETNVGTGTLTYAAFSAVGTADTFVLARVTFTASGTSGAETTLDLSVTAAGDAIGTNITTLVQPVSSAVKIE